MSATRRSKNQSAAEKESMQLARWVTKHLHIAAKRLVVHPWYAAVNKTGEWEKIIPTWSACRSSWWVDQYHKMFGGVEMFMAVDRGDVYVKRGGVSVDVTDMLVSVVADEWNRLQKRELLA